MHLSLRPFRSLGRTPVSLLGLAALLSAALLVLTSYRAEAAASSPVATAATQSNIYSGYTRIGYVSRSYGGRVNIYDGYSRAGYLSRSYGARWNVYDGYSKVGYVKASYGGRWDIYEGYSKVGYVKRSYGGHWNVYDGYTKAGYVSGTLGPQGGAALLLVLGG